MNVENTQSGDMTTERNKEPIELKEVEVSLRDFLKAFGYGDRESVYYRTFNDKDKTKPAMKHEVMVMSCQSLETYMEKLNADNYGIYFVVNGGGSTDAEVIKSGCCKAQFMEIDDLSFDDQLKLINEFIAETGLKPSIIVKTQKSLHVYWLISKGNIKRFKPIQEKLISRFNSDNTIKNPSRVMRVPNFYHCKGDPVLVKVVYFHPEHIYTQDELEAVLPEVKKDKALLKGNINPPTVDDLNTPDAIKSIRYVDEFMERHNIAYRKDIYMIAGETSVMMYYLLNINSIPWADEYTTPWKAGDTQVHVRPSGKICISGRHSSDERHQWAEFKEHYEPDCKDYYAWRDCKRSEQNEDSQKDFRVRFHVWSKPNADGVSHPTDIIESEITEDIVNSKNIIVISGLPYIYHGGVYEQDETGNNTRAIIKEYIYKRLHTVNRINRVYNLLIMDTSIVKDIDEVNAYPKRWINFKNGMLDAEKMEMHEHRPEYYSINQIPWEYKEGYTIPDDSMVLKCLREKIPDEEDREMFLQFNGYGLTTDTHAQKFMVYFGDGNTGKSTLIRLQDALIGKQNRTSLSLQDINKRFFPTCLFGKLMNLCADIPSEAMSAIDVLKKATGEDQIMGEYKGGAVFFFKSYAKLLFSANSIPLSYDDKTNAFYRRMLLLEIQRGEFMSDLEDKLHEDMQSYIHLCVDALHRMYNSGELKESENSKTEVEKLRMKADTVFAFMSERCERDNTKSTKRDELYKAYEWYCTAQGRTALTKHRFYSTLEDNGIPTRTGDHAMYVKGIKVNPSSEDIPL